MSEATVHRLRWDLDRYQAFLYDLPEPDPDLWTFNGRPRLDAWDPPPVYVEQPRLDIPDIWCLIGAAVLVMPREVVDSLEPHLSSAGELLPMKVLGPDKFFALNILQDVDCIDEGSLSLETMNLRPGFITHRLPETGLFKVPLVDTTHIFHVERDDDDDSFMQRVLREQLTGISFEPVWSSRTGPRPVNLFV